MKNYLLRGLSLVVLGIALVTFGWFLKTETDITYGWAMVCGVITFGVGFVTVVYSLIRKVEYHSIIEERHHKAKEFSQSHLS